MPDRVGGAHRGDRCLIGKGTGIVGHLRSTSQRRVDGHNVYITDQNHGYDDIHPPHLTADHAGAPVVIGDGSCSVSAPSCCQVRGSDATSRSAPTRWVTAISPTTASRRGSGRRDPPLLDGKGWVRPAI